MREASVIRPIIAWLLSLFVMICSGCGKAEYDSRMQTRIQQLRSAPPPTAEEDEDEADVSEPDEDDEDMSSEDDEDADPADEEPDDEVQDGPVENPFEAGETDADDEE